MKHNAFSQVIAGYTITLTQTGKHRFTVTYGHEETKNLNYNEAAERLGYCILHALACEGKIAINE
jgi:gamma-glutamyl:cysteine ligase YbdK (ATP-grasp superfamily)